MTSDYDSTAAYHYAAYRPPLHEVILANFVTGHRSLDRGLDIGCGTGYSSIALSKHCCKVLGVDISQEMLDQAISHPKVSYQYYDGNQLDCENQNFDLITFAGSLVYAKSQGLLDEVLRVSKRGAKILVYDFDVMLDPVLEKLGMDLSIRPVSNYNHDEDFSGLEQKGLLLDRKERKDIGLGMDHAEFIHLALSAKDNYDLIKMHLGPEDLDRKLGENLKVAFEQKISVVALTFGTLYRVV